MWDIDLNFDSFWLSRKFCLEWFVASGQVKAFILVFFSIQYFDYARYGGKERLSWFIPVEITLQFRYHFCFLFFFPWFCLYFCVCSSFSSVFLHNTVFFLLLWPLAHWILECWWLNINCLYFPLSMW